MLLPAATATARWRGEPWHGEAPALELPPEPVQAFHPDPLPQPLHLVQDGPETLVQLLARFRQANEPPFLAPLLHNCIRINCGWVISHFVRYSQYMTDSEIVFFSQKLLKDWAYYIEDGHRQ